jgi:hypothetical protein
MTGERTDDPTPPPGGRVLRLRTKSRALSDAHRAHLRASGLADESIDAGGFFTERDGREIAAILGWKGWPKTRGDGLVIPFYLPTVGAGAEPFFARVRPDHPRTDERSGKVAKYEQPKDTPVAPYFPIRSRVHRRYEPTSTEPLVFTEGEKKAALLDQLGFAAIGATGVSCFHDAPHRKETDEYRLHELIRRHVHVTGRHCFVAFDSDQIDNDQVTRAGRILSGMLHAAGAASVRNVLIPTPEGGGKLGIDDFFAIHGEAATRALFDAAEPLEGASGNESADYVVAYRVLEGIPLDPKLRMPHEYSLDRDGTLWRDDGGKRPKLVERAPIFISRLVADLYNGHELVELVFRRDRRWRTVVVPRRTMVDSRALVGDLGPLGAPVDTNNAAEVVRWLRDFEATNERRLPRSLSVNRCGWHAVKGEDVFVLAGEVLKREGSTVELVVDRQADRMRLSRGLRTTGDRDAHVDALRRAWAADPICATIIAAALAAPLLRILGAPIFAVHLAGDSSRGKSSMLKIAASVYGDPRDEEWVSSWNSTAVGHEMRAAHLSDLPFAIDESGVVDAKDRERAVYMLMNGVGRTRGAKDGGLRETQQWRTIVLSTGEQRLTGEDAATGAQVRIISLNVSRFGTLAAGGVDELRRGVEESFGHVGREWIETWLETGEDARAAHRAAFKAYAKTFQERAQSGTANARQAIFWALLAYTESVAHSALGLGQADGATIARLFADPSDAHTEIRSAADRALERVQHWIHSEPSAFLELVFLPSGARGLKTSDRPPREIYGYSDPGENRLLILPLALRKFLAAASIDDAVVLREWKAKGHLAVAKGDDRFTTQVRIGAARHRVISIDGKVLGLEGEAGSGDSGAVGF